MTTILVVDDMPIFREPIAASLRLAGFAAQTAGDGRDALTQVTQKRPDLILLDLAMPVMDGIAFLAALREQPETRTVPVILLTAHSDRTRVLEAAKLGICEYMLKSQFSLQDLVNRVKKHTGHEGSPAPAPVPASARAPAAAASTPAPTSAADPRICDRDKLVLLTREETRARLHGIKGTQTCAGVVAEVMALTSSAHTNVADLVRVLEADPVLASRVLQLSNSPMYRQKYNRLSSIGEAVRNVGTRAIQNMVISVSIFQTFPPDAADGFNTLRCWQHCFAVAAILRLLLARQEEAERERVALIGLCHDLGEIVLRQHFASEYTRILDHARHTGLPIATAEATALSMRHSELVNEVITRIGLPSNIAIPIMRFHEGALGRGTGTGGSEDLQAVRALQVANWIAHGILLAPSSNAPVTPLPRADFKRACGEGDFTFDLPALRDEVLTATNALARLPAADEKLFITPQFTRAQTRVWYARHAGYVDLDPLGTALHFLSAVHPAERLPETPAELDATDFILVAAPFFDAAPLVIANLRRLADLPGYRGQPILALVGNPVGAVTIPHVRLLTLPVTLDTLASAFGQVVPTELASAS